MLGASSFIFDLARTGDAAAREPLPVLNGAGDQFSSPSCWSADGKLLYGNPLSRSDDVVAYDPATKRYETLPVQGAPVPLRDGHRLLVGWDDAISLFDRQSGKKKLVLSAQPDDIAHIFALSRDEQWIYFSVKSTEADVWLAELR